jgi:hypothetical protein
LVCCHLIVNSIGWVVPREEESRSGGAVIATENGSDGSKITVQIPEERQPMAVQNDSAAPGYIAVPGSMVSPRQVQVGEDTQPCRQSPPNLGCA